MQVEGPVSHSKATEHLGLAPLPESSAKILLNLKKKKKDVHHGVCSQKQNRGERSVNELLVLLAVSSEFVIGRG